MKKNNFKIKIDQDLWDDIKYLNILTAFQEGQESNTEEIFDEIMTETILN